MKGRCFPYTSYIEVIVISWLSVNVSVSLIIVIMEKIDRIKMLIKKRAKSERDFALKIGMKQATLNLYVLGKSKLSLEAVDLILKAFPDISAEWLLRGEGNMTKEFGCGVNENLSYQTEDLFYMRIIEEQLYTISMLRRRITELEAKKDDA
jgi:transcriptional regulator with XRE-family HTH domain